MSNYRDNQVHMIADYEGDVTELIKDREKGIYPILVLGTSFFSLPFSPLSSSEEVKALLY